MYVKKIFFIILIIITMCSCFFTGYKLCERRTRPISGDTTNRVEQLKQQLTRTESELEQRIAEITVIEQQLNEVGLGIDDCLGVARQLGDNLKQCREELRGSNPIIEELRKRITEYEEQVRTMQSTIERLQASINK